MELQCKERVDLFDTIRKSRDEAKSRSNESLNLPSAISRPRGIGSTMTTRGQDSALGGGSIAPSSYSSISRPPLPVQKSSQSIKPLEAPPCPPSSHKMAAPAYPRSSSSATLEPPRHVSGLEPSRSPSPEKRSIFRSTLRPERKDRNGNPAPKMAQTMRPKPAKNASKAASLAWPGQNNSGQLTLQPNGSTSTLTDPVAIRQASVEAALARQSHDNHRSSSPPLASTIQRYSVSEMPMRPHTSDQLPIQHSRLNTSQTSSAAVSASAISSKPPPPPPPYRTRAKPEPEAQDASPTEDRSISGPPQPPAFPSYRKEYPAPAPLDSRKVASISRNPPGRDTAADTNGTSLQRSRPTVARKAVPKPSSPPSAPRRDSNPDQSQSSSSEVDRVLPRRRSRRQVEQPLAAELPGRNVESKASLEDAWDARVKHLMENLPKGVDKDAATNIFNEIVIKGDEVHWEDVAGLDIAKNALKEAVVYPFLRPDLFMGLREPARGMLLFGPPGTGKTMLARAVATESHSTFFAISASSLTSKFLGESEKLVRALFALAKALTPSIIFVDEIDSLLSARSGSGEHEATRRIKTEFLIQWSDLAKAAAGREQTDGDASRVLVLAATNLPWAIDEAARRRFVRRQYIPLPESHVREDQLRRLMSAQKLSLSDKEFAKLVALTDGRLLTWRVKSFESFTNTERRLLRLRYHRSRERRRNGSTTQSG